MSFYYANLKFETDKSDINQTLLAKYNSMLNINFEPQKYSKMTEEKCPKQK
jgi:hypothetical protein